MQKYRCCYIISISNNSIQVQKSIIVNRQQLSLYKKASFQEALAIFNDIENWDTKTNQAIYKIYIERCSHYIECPPTEFNGVFEHTTKG